jgi:hypothetical protein
VKIQWTKLITTNFTQLFALLYMNIQPCLTIDGLILVWFIVAVSFIGGGNQSTSGVPIIGKID